MKTLSRTFVKTKRQFCEFNQISIKKFQILGIFSAHLLNLHATMLGLQRITLRKLVSMKTAEKFLLTDFEWNNFGFSAKKFSAQFQNCI